MFPFVNRVSAQKILNKLFQLGIIPFLLCTSDYQLVCFNFQEKPASCRVPSAGFAERR